MTNIQKISRFQDALAYLKSLRGLEMQSYYEKVKTLHFIKDARLYADEYPTWREFVINSRIGSLSDINHHIQVYEVIFKDHPNVCNKLANGNVKPTDLRLIIPEINRDPSSFDKWIDWLSSAESDKDVRKAITEAKTGIIPEECDHENRPIKMTEQCVKCKTFKVTTYKEDGSKEE